MIYFDNATTSFPKPPEVARFVALAIETMGAPHRGAYPLALEASRNVYNCRAAIADFFNIEEPASVIFTSGATEGLNAAINGLLSEADHVITTVTEHNAVLRPLYRLGCSLDILPCDPNGVVLFNNINQRLTPKTKAVVCSHMSNVTGNCIDVAFLSRFCRDNGLYFLLDCAQSAGNIPMDASLAHVTCFSGHKALFGPQGTGGMIVNNAPVKPFKTGGTGHQSREREQPPALPDRLEAGTLNGHGLAGLLAGLSFINKISLEAIIEKETTLSQYFIEGLATIKKVKTYGDFTQRERGAIVSLSAEGYGSEEVSAILAENHIATRSGLHCAPLIHQALGTEQNGLTRFSFSYFNTIEEINSTLTVLASL